MKEKPDTFESLSLPQRDVPQLLLSRYRVYKDAKEYVLVEAENAMEALKASGVVKAARIERDILFFNNVLKLDVLAEKSAEALVAVAAPTAETMQETAPLTAEIPQAEPAAPATSDAPLSDEDVNKLLQNGAE